MAPRKLSPKREKKEEKKEYDMMKMSGYGAMALYTLLCLAAVASVVLFIIYGAESHGRNEDETLIDQYEHDFGRMQISAYASIISILGAILILLAWVAYNVHRHSGSY